MNLDLINQKCQACSGNTPKLNEQEISNHLSKLNNWYVNDDIYYESVWTIDRKL